MQKPRDASELVGRYIMWIIIVAIAWPLIMLIPAIASDSEGLILFPYKYWWLSLSIIALIVWNKNIQYYFGSVRSDVIISKPIVNKVENKVEELEQDAYLGNYTCSNCNKKLSYNEDKYSYGKKIACSNCFEELKNKMDINTLKIKNKKHIEVSSKNPISWDSTCFNCNQTFSHNERMYSYLGKVVCSNCKELLNKKEDIELASGWLNISSGQLKGEKFQYTKEEFVKFRQKKFKDSQKEQLGFSSYRWFINNYVKDNKISKKDLNLFLDLQLDLSPDYSHDGDVVIDKDLLIRVLDRHPRFNELELAKKIKEKGKWDLLINFVKKNVSIDVQIASESERRKLIKILAKYDITAADEDLHLVLGSISGEIEYKKFKKKVSQKKPKKLNDYVDVFLEIFGENYESHLGFLAQILYDNSLLNKVGLIKPLAEKRKEELEIERYEKKLTEGKISEKEIDFLSMSGHQFEYFLGDLFKKMGYKVMNTKLSGDQGADLVIEKFKEKIAVQAKNYTKPVSNTAVQEAVAAKNHYGCHKAMVVTTDGYTKGAKSLAKSNYVELWDKERLLKEVKKYF